MLQETKRTETRGTLFRVVPPRSHHRRSSKPSIQLSPFSPEDQPAEENTVLSCLSLTPCCKYDIPDGLSVSFSVDQSVSVSPSKENQSAS